ncbi:hypothetical protein ACFWR9_14595 [Streptomyces sp. NPDC058534]|uniref:hypothetical protein n=1 Tax=Streptomyces sp. NPDC058534 TaxID=3346541 RepID=UPI00364A6714
MRPKHYLALLAVPLGASFMLYPSGSAQAAEASPSIAPSQVCNAVSTAPPNPFGQIRASGFDPGESVRVSADGQVISTPIATAATVGPPPTPGGVVGVFGISLTARSYVLEGLSSGKVATCPGLGQTPPPPPDGPVTPPTTPSDVRAEGRRDGLADGLASCRTGRTVTDAQDDEEGPRNAEYFAGYAAGKAEALDRTACTNRPPQTTQPGQTDRDQQNRGDRDRDRDRDRNRGGNR